MASLTIEHLPHELLIHCCSFLQGSTPDVQSLRLTSKRLHDASSFFLVDTLTIRITTKSISMLEAVSNHPIISKGIKTIKLCLCFYGDVEDGQTKVGLLAVCDRRIFALLLQTARAFNAVERAPEETEQFQLIQSRVNDIRRGLTSVELGSLEATTDSESRAIRVILNSLEVYKSRLVDQQVVVKDGSHIRRIGVALSKLARPSSLEIFGYDRTENDIDSSDCSIATMTEKLNSDEVCLDIFLDAMTSRGQYLTLDMEGLCAKTFMGIFAQLSRQQICPSHISIDLDAPKYLELFRPSESEHEMISRVVQRAEDLSFTVRWWSKRDINFGVFKASQEEMQDLASLTSAFFNTETVRFLDLNLYDYSIQVDPPRVGLYDFFPDCKWPQLESLSLVSLPFHERELRRLVDRHRDSLRILDMHGLHIISGTWRNSLDILRGLNCLEEVSCDWPAGAEFGNGAHEDDLVYSYSERAVCEYILRVGDMENPLG
ncbi:hypothetical protein AJ79_04982 [Helicocarpus griseus UAMH5409]|uniref:F-box domain-containing protein n=1 Tax=Helicocarpus griseus UAMH5409 TaxID=1447875 RepID=A0A2B7XRM3_9EURO|nr:hypothetical protein AJ79_04982 [Helicocarpus griseus UAMH5409]